MRRCRRSCGLNSGTPAAPHALAIRDGQHPAVHALIVGPAPVGGPGGEPNARALVALGRLRRECWYDDCE